MPSTDSSPTRSAFRPASPRSSPVWARLCAETLAGIADPLFPALRCAAASGPRQAAALIARALLAPLEADAPDEPLPVWLLPHQAEAVRRARGILGRFGGVLVADGVGLGKTFVGLALAALERQGGGCCAAVVPAAIRDEWERAMAHTGVVVPLRTHTGLAETDPPDEPTTLLLVDEAHAFRNPRTRRYDALARLAHGRRVALLTATPFNNAPADVASLVALFAGRDRFRGLGVADLAQALRSPEARTAQLALGALSVCRTRRLVERRYPDLAAMFPRRVLEPPVRYDLAAVYGGALQPVLDHLEAVAGTMRCAESAASLVHLGLLRRLESSPAALAASLRHHRAFAEDALAAARAGRRLTRREFARARGTNATDDQLLLWELLLGEAAASDAPLAAFLAAVQDAERAVGAVVAAEDPKVEALSEMLSRQAPPAIVFTEYRATALHLMRRLRRRFRVLTVTGAEAWAGAERVNRTEALDAFAPLGRGRRPHRLLAADVLVTTDVASEGMNLQDARVVANFDLPWNPVRVMQRAGRIDRLGSPHARVHVAHMVPGGGLERLTGVLGRLEEKLALAAVAPSAEPDPLAALWWLGRGLAPAAMDAEAWRRVAPFEAWERWQALASGGSETDGPVIAGAVTADGDTGVGILLQLSWRARAPIPLPYVLHHGGAVAEDAVALTALAEQCARGRSVRVEAAQFAEALATVLPLARARAGALHAAWRGAVPRAPGRRAVLAMLDRETLRARRERRDATPTEDAAARLLHDVPAGLERRLGDLARSAPGAEVLARTVATLTARLPVADLDAPAPPRLALVAAIVVTAACPGRD